MPSYQPEDLRADLLYLRKGPGYAPERLASRPALVSILGGTREAPEVHRERLESAIQSLHDPDAELLIDLFVLGEAMPSTLAARRDTLGARLGIGREAVADRDTGAIERLLEQLITGWYPKSPTGIRIPESHNGFVQHAVSVKTYVQDGRHLESLHHYRLFALFDGVEYLGVSTNYPATPVPLGNAFTVRTREVAGGYMYQFWHREPMRRGRTYDMRYQVSNMYPEEAEFLTEESMAFHEPTRFAKFEVHFIGRVPEIAWSFRGLSAQERPGEILEGQAITLHSGTSIATSFDNMYGGLYCGMAWRW